MPRRRHRVTRALRAPPEAPQGDVGCKTMMSSSQIAAFEADIKAVDQRFNFRLFIGIGVMLPLSFLYDRSALKTGLLDVILIVFVLGSLLHLILGIVKGKNAVCREYGLACPHCHCIPRAFFAVNAIRSGICPQCKQEMSTQQGCSTVSSEGAPSEEP